MKANKYKGEKFPTFYILEVDDGQVLRLDENDQFHITNPQPKRDQKVRVKSWIIPRSMLAPVEHIFRIPAVAHSDNEL